MNNRSYTRLEKAHPLLQALFIEAAKECPVEIEVGEVARSEARQRELVAAGASWTMNSRHRPKVPADPQYPRVPVSHAVDFICYVGGKVRWDWPLYSKAAAHIKQVAKDMNIDIVWGGDWKQRDGPHIELKRSTYL
jgi:peptidoglycan L-alanyl-D-glutamate endopeptidase CwlK